MNDDGELFALTDPAARSLAFRNDASFLSSKVTNRAAAERLNVSPSHLSQWKKDNLPRLWAVLAAHDMKVVDKSDKRVSTRVLHAYQVLVAEHMAADLGDTAPGVLDE